MVFGKMAKICILDYKVRRNLRILRMHPLTTLTQHDWVFMFGKMNPAVYIDETNFTQLSVE